MFKKIFTELCNEKGVAPTKACTDNGLSNAAYSCWTDNTIPRQATLLKFAKYFNVSVDYLLGKEKKPSAPEGTEDMGENEKRLFAIWHQVPDEQKPELLNLIEAALRMQQGNSEK